MLPVRSPPSNGCPDDVSLSNGGSFDSRGVTRTYDMAFAGRVWTLQRLAADPDFSQRFTGRFCEDDEIIVGRWEMSRDGSNWSHDFDLTYSRVD